MAVLETLVYQVLRDNAGVAAVVSGRIYPLILPQGCILPAISYERVSTSPVVSLSGFSNLESARVQIDCMASTYSAAKGLAALVFTAMNSATLFKSVPLGQTDILENDTMTYRVSMDFSAWNIP